MQGESDVNEDGLDGKTVGVFGGTFDPVHLGHVGLAEDALAASGLDRVLWIPNKRSPLKPDAEMASDAHRWAMLQAALSEHPSFALSRVELDGADVSYSIETLDRLAAGHPTARFRFIMGGDSVPDLPRWREGERLVMDYDPVVVARPGTGDVLAACGLGADAVARLRAGLVALHLRPISSTEIRNRVAQGKSLIGLVPDGVADYIRRHRLYQPAGAETDS